MSNEDFFADLNPESTISDNLQSSAQEAAPAFEAPSWEDVRAGKIKYQDLPPAMKTKVKQEAYEETPEDKKYLWDDYNFTPPETYHGVDRNGRPAEALGLEGFEELVKKGRIKPRTKIEQDVENLANIVKEQSKNILSQQEREIEDKLSKAKEDMDFEAYDKLREKREDVKFQKLQLDKAPARQEANPRPDYSEQYPLDVQVAIKTFADNNKDFVDLMRKSSEMRSYFDEVGGELYERNKNTSHEEILAATKKLVENRFNLNKSERPMFRNTIQSSQKTNLDSKVAPRLTFNALNDRDKRFIQSAARSGSSKYAGRSLDDIANMVYSQTDLYKQIFKK